MILSRSKLAALCNQLRQQSQRIVFTNGCFDILHAGHVTYLQKARELGDVLVVGVNSDDSVRRLKGASRPVNNEDDRALVIDALRCVDYVCLFPEDTPLELITALLPNVLVKGGDYTPETIVGADVVRSHGGKVEVIPLVDGKSTTNIIRKIHET